MAAPADPYDQPLIQESPDLGVNVGSVAPGRFVTWGYDDAVGASAFILWRILNGSVARVAARATPPGFTFYGSAENDNGVVAVWGMNEDGPVTYVAGHLKTDLTIDFFEIAFPAGMWMSGDGEEIVFSVNEWNYENDLSDTHLYGYSLTGVPVWDFLIDTSTNILTGWRPSGYVAGVPRAGRVVWVNTTIATYSSTIESTFEATEGDSWILYGTAEESPSYPVIAQNVLFKLTWSGRNEAGVNPSYPYPSSETGAQVARINGAIVNSDLNASGWTTQLFYVVSFPNRNVIPTAPGSAFSYELTVDPYYGPTWGQWWSANEFYYFGSYGGGYVTVTYDLSEWGGNHIELRDGSGSVLDRIETPSDFQADAQWIGIGADAIAGFPITHSGGGG